MLGWLFTGANPWLKQQVKTKTAPVLGLTVSLLLALANSVQALQVQVEPENPQLGDTLSVVISTDASDSATPTVISPGGPVPAFPIGGNRYRAMIPTTPLSQAGRWEIRVDGEGQTRNIAVWVSDREFPTQSIWLPPGKDDLEGTDMEFDRVDEFKKLVTPEKFWNGAFLRPNDGPITTIYGVRRYYNGVFADDYYHRGVDYAGPQGSPVVAPSAGRIALVGRESEGFEIHGNVVGIDHGQGLTSLYLHLSRIDVKEGDMVQPGQVIGAVGSTGASTGPHLHWGLYVHGQSIDPVPWRYEGVE
ncbi:M23 family metallopeptidase [Laspinema sp. D2d]|uniref:M23 family metallopeptidase n=1 Tax=Laspinema sp. D2d TaxID=2953686 RepID=UPI0039832AA8